MNPDAPGIGDFVKAGKILQATTTNADLRAATDTLASGAQAIGLDQFKPFLRKADDHLTRQGGLLALMRDVPTAALVSSTPGSPLLGHKTGLVTLVNSATPTVPPPDIVPGGPWTWSVDPNNGRGGKFVGSSGATASWDALDGHWDVDNGQGERTRYNRFGAPLTPKRSAWTI